MPLPDARVRAARDTALPRSQVARTARGIIAELPGLRTGDALASAVLTAAAPQWMAVYDQRVRRALNTLDLTPAAEGHGRCLQLLDGLLQHRAARADAWTARGHRHRPLLDRPPL